MELVLINIEYHQTYLTIQLRNKTGPRKIQENLVADFERSSWKKFVRKCA